ncbi:hypothetical protein IMSAGC013_02723 [Lachnospiraceae bacterium]|jgi:hypothetical protein|nr:hypothetical protein IMSAGC013_02723 [Lachnospiraceae bacterium]
MLCRRCNVVMSISGTLYESKRSKDDKGYRRYNECPSCHYKKFINGLNFQEVMNKEIQKNRSR